MWPTMMLIFVSWMPVDERGALIGFSSSGAQFGTIIGFSLGGYLCVHGFDGGWPSIFYYFGIIKKSRLLKKLKFILVLFVKM